MSVAHPAPLAIAPPTFIGLPATLTAELPSSGLGAPHAVQKARTPRTIVGAS